MKRIRFEGRALSKYDMATIMEDRFHSRLPWFVMYDAFTYEEMVSFFKECCSKFGINI